MAPLFKNVLQGVLVPAVLGSVVLMVTFDIVGRLENLLTIYATSILAVWMGKTVAPSLEEAAATETDEGAVRSAPLITAGGEQ